MIGHSVRSEAEWLLLRRARDGELTRVGGVYLHRGRDYVTEPIEELVVAGLLADPDPAAEAMRLVLTDAGRERFVELARRTPTSHAGCMSASAAGTEWCGPARPCGLGRAASPRPRSGASDTSGVVLRSRAGLKVIS